MPPTLELPGAIPRRLHGYDAQTIDALLTELTAAQDDLLSDCRRLRAKVEAIQAELTSSEDLERAMREVFVSAQREADEMRASALREVGAIKEEQRKRAQGADSWVDDEGDRIRAEIARIYALEQELRVSTRELVLVALRRLEEPAAPEQETPQAETTVTETRANTPTVVEPEPRVVEPESSTVEEQPTVIGPDPMIVAAEPIAVESEVSGAAQALDEVPAPSLEDDTIDIPIVETVTEPPAAAPVELEILLAEPAAPPTEPPDVAPAAARAFPLRAALASVGILAAGAAIAILIWQLRSDEETAAVTVTVATPVATQTVEVAPPPNPSETAADTQSSSSAATTAPAENAGAAPSPPPDTAAPTVATVVVRAVGGDSWVSVRRGSANGTLLYEGFLFEDESRRFKAERIWMRIGNPTNLVARLNGKPLDLPAGTADVLFTPEGAETLALG